MKQQIYFYKLFLFGHKGEDDYISLSQIQGQQLSMILATDPSRKFTLQSESNPDPHICSVGRMWKRQTR